MKPPLSAEGNRHRDSESLPAVALLDGHEWFDLSLMSVARRLQVAQSRPHGRFAICPLSTVDQTSNLRCRLFHRIGLLVEAKPTWVNDCTWSPVDPEQTLTA